MVKTIMLINIPICGFLWALTGAPGFGKVWRRVWAPVCIALTAWLVSGRIEMFLIIPFMIGPLSLGYGIPDSTDTGSPLGRFWFSLLKTPNESRFNFTVRTARKTRIMVRVTIAALTGLALLPCIFSGSWIFGAIIGVWFNIYFGAISSGLGKTWILNNEEILIGASWGLASFLCLL